MEGAAAELWRSRFPLYARQRRVEWATRGRVKQIPYRISPDTIDW